MSATSFPALATFGARTRGNTNQLDHAIAGNVTIHSGERLRGPGRRRTRIGVRAPPIAHAHDDGDGGREGGSPAVRPPQYRHELAVGVRVVVSRFTGTCPPRAAPHTHTSRPPAREDCSCRHARRCRRRATGTNTQIANPTVVNTGLSLCTRVRPRI